MNTEFPLHDWVRPQEVAFFPGPMDPVTEQVLTRLRETFTRLGHTVVPEPRPGHTRIIMTSAVYGEDLSWRKALLFNLRRRFGFRRLVDLWTVTAVSPERLEADLTRLQKAWEEGPEGLLRLSIPGLAQTLTAAEAIWEYGRRGGPLAMLERILQVQLKSIRILLVVGETRPEYAYLFDLVGAYPRVVNAEEAAFYEELVHRMAAFASTHSVSHHEMVGEPVPRPLWETLEAPKAMMRASRAFKERDFFSPMIRISDVAPVPGRAVLSAMIAEQYSEGCFATWEPRLNALVATVTGSARPVYKGEVQEKDLAVIVGVRPDGMGAYYRPVEGLPNDPPSSEAVELFQMDAGLPRITWNGYEVPVARSKLHGHRGVRAFDPKRVEFVPLPPSYHKYTVTCASDAQAKAIIATFSRAQALRNPDDPRTLVFTIVPCHGVVIVEKWVPGKVAFQEIWEAIDTGALEIALSVPQGPFGYRPGEDGRMHYTEDPTYWPWRMAEAALSAE